MHMEQYKPLKGVKVVELSLMVASASCGRMMADWVQTLSNWKTQKAVTISVNGRCPSVLLQMMISTRSLTT